MTILEVAWRMLKRITQLHKRRNSRAWTNYQLQRVVGSKTNERVAGPVRQAIVVLLLWSAKRTSQEYICSHVSYLFIGFLRSSQGHRFQCNNFANPRFLTVLHDFVPEDAWYSLPSPFFPHLSLPVHFLYTTPSPLSSLSLFFAPSISSTMLFAQSNFSTPLFAPCIFSTLLFARPFSPHSSLPVRFALFCLFYLCLFFVFSSVSLCFVWFPFVFCACFTRGLPLDSKA